MHCPFCSAESTCFNCRKNETPEWYAKQRADARALWSVRVLDAWAEARRGS